MPGRNLNDRGNAALFCYLQRAQTVARPAVKQIVTPGGKMPGCDPIKVFFFRAVVVGPIEK